MNDSTHDWVLNRLTVGMSALMTRAIKTILGPSADHAVLGPLTWGDLALVLCLGLLALAAHGMAATFVRRKSQRADASGSENALWRQLLLLLGKPIYSLIWVGGIYVAAGLVVRKLLSEPEWDAAQPILVKLADLAVFAILFRLFFRLTRVIEAHFTSLAAKTGNKLDELFVPLLGKCVRILVPVVGVILALPVLDLPSEYAGLIAKGTSILLIVAVAAILFEAVGLGENVTLLKFDVRVSDNLNARKVRTQVQVISKTLYIVIGIFTVASILMLFAEVRHLGASILASAGVVGVVVGFAAQKSIANLFAGFQIAVAQPIRIDDVVVVEGEWGRIEEITLTYVVIHIWDDRRLVVPLSEFIEKPFQNWTRVSADLMGSVFLWVDYSLPLEETRDAARQIIEASPLWDRRFWNLQVSDSSERTMQIRVLVTTRDSSKSWDLRCEVREKLIAYIQLHHPGCLPRLRADVASLEPSGGSPAPQRGNGNLAQVAHIRNASAGPALPNR